VSEDYLWDRSGKPDPEIVRLEGLLGQLRWREEGRKSNKWRRMRIGAAIAAVLILGVALSMKKCEQQGRSRPGSCPSGARKQARSELVR
jgi:hypothetical protein